MKDQVLQCSENDTESDAEINTANNAWLSLDKGLQK